MSNMTASTPRTAECFDDMFHNNPNPWRFKSRWYEKRKRALTLGCLPAERHVNGFEPGCANGELSADLATRCDQLLCSDGSAMAVQAARARARNTQHRSAAFVVTRRVARRGFRFDRCQ